MTDKAFDGKPVVCNPTLDRARELIDQSRPYYILVTRYAKGAWSMEFGDYSMDVVRQELTDWIDGDGRRHGAGSKDARVISLSTDTQAAIDAKVRELNA